MQNTNENGNDLRRKVSGFDKISIHLRGKEAGVEGERGREKGREEARERERERK